VTTASGIQALPTSWADALEQVNRRRSRLHYKPVALLVSLDMLDEADDSDYRVKYGDFRDRFASLLSTIDLHGADKAWQPFYDLATGEQVWTLWRNGAVLNPSEISPSATTISRMVDEARFRDALQGFIRARSGRQIVREAVLNMLSEDADPVSIATLEEYQRRSPLSLVETSDEIRRSLLTFNSEVSDYLPFARDLARSTTYWVFDPDSRQFGPGKFVGFKGMVSWRYLYARTVRKSRFNGHTTRVAIERVVKVPFRPDADLASELEAWMTGAYGQMTEQANDSKWKFVTLPTTASGIDPSTSVPDAPDIFVMPHLRMKDLLESAPSSGRIPEVRLVDRARIIDWAERDAANRDLGSFGERLVAELERRELSDAGRADLADRVEIVAQTQGDGLGFDVLSFTTEGEEKYLEVKTTQGAKETPFIVSENERLRSEILGDSLWLYRVFKVCGQWRLFQLRGPFSETLHLRPTQYRAVVNDRGQAE
jgi:Domain of unknown function (DUF3883)